MHQMQRLCDPETLKSSPKKETDAAGTSRESGSSTGSSPEKAIAAAGAGVVLPSPAKQDKQISPGSQDKQPSSTQM